jgi:stage II sporulation protein D
VRLEEGQWRAEGERRSLGSGELIILPGHEGSVLVNDRQYRGRFRLVPTGPRQFDVINDVDIDGYLKGVIAEELYSGWNAQTYAAQAIVARTYALYEAKTAGLRRHWDLYPDQRSQVYGGMSAETSKSRAAVEKTAGIVVAYGLPGQERIFKAYFSSCCGGISQSAYDAFGEGYSQPLSEQNRGKLCGISNRYSWPEVTVRKDELARRLALWAQRKSEATGRSRPELQMAGVARIDAAYVNKLGRPVYFFVTDTRGVRFMMRAEELRSAINTDVRGGDIVYSGYFKTANGSEAIRFYDGHGFGHGVGMCQWCAEAMARKGMAHEDIVVRSYPGGKLVRGY